MERGLRRPWDGPEGSDFEEWKLRLRVEQAHAAADDTAGSSHSAAGSDADPSAVFRANRQQQKELQQQAREATAREAAHLLGAHELRLKKLTSKVRGKKLRVRGEDSEGDSASEGGSALSARESLSDSHSGSGAGAGGHGRDDADDLSLSGDDVSVSSGGSGLTGLSGLSAISGLSGLSDLSNVGLQRLRSMMTTVRKAIVKDP